MARAIFDGNIPFYISSNKVILTEGKEGVLPARYFRTVTDFKKDELIFQQPFKYIMVYDFECQCEREKGTLKFQEIIEFPVVVIDVEKKQIVAEFQKYVRPTVDPILTEFCTELTGIK